MKRILAALGVSAALCGGARAQQIAQSPADLLEDFTCPGQSCQTECVGPGGPLAFGAKDVKVYQYSEHPRRLWLDADGQVYVLGDDDRCHFGGNANVPFATQPIQSSPLQPPQPACICIGGQCTPPGCAPRPAGH